MKKASTRLLEQETQTPSPAPDLIPAESSTENLHWDWYSKRGHFITIYPRPLFVIDTNWLTLDELVAIHFARPYRSICGSRFQ